VEKYEEAPDEEDMLMVIRALSGLAAPEN